MSNFPRITISIRTYVHRKNVRQSNIDAHVDAWRSDGIKLNMYSRHQVKSNTKMYNVRLLLIKDNVQLYADK